MGRERQQPRRERPGESRHKSRRKRSSREAGEPGRWLDPRLAMPICERDEIH
jgi:hypothetical protein